MKKLLIGLLALGATSSFANCTIDVNLHSSMDNGASINFLPHANHIALQEETLENIYEVLDKKGYQVVDEKGYYSLHLSYHEGEDSRFILGLGNTGYATVVRGIFLFNSKSSEEYGKRSKLYGKEKAVRFVSEDNIDLFYKNRIDSLDWLASKAKKLPTCTQK